MLFTEATNKRLALLFFCLSSVMLIGTRQYVFGMIAFLLSVLFWLGVKEKGYKASFGLLYVVLLILRFTPVNTKTTNSHFLAMGIPLLIVLIMPYLLSKMISKNMITYKWFPSEWTPRYYWYVIIATIIGYFLIPFYFKSVPAVYAEWSVEATRSSIYRLFVGTNLLGIWDELFFINTVLAILRRYYKFWTANIAQAVLFTAFLYELAFIGWGPIMIFVFALTQGAIFRRVKSVLYIVAIHLIVDSILFAVIIESHIPGFFANVLPFF